MKGWKIEKFASDVMWDLRQRRLLPVVAALVGALVIVPVLLSGGSASTAPPGPPSVDVDAPEAGSAVLAYEAGLRDYRKRLNELQGKDPFVQHFSGVDASAAELGGALAAVEGASAVTQATSGGSGGGAPAETPSSGGGGGGGGDDPDPVVKPPKPQTRYVTYAVDVKVGEVGSLQSRPDIFNLAFLPSDSVPVVVFIGASGDGKSAIFLVSSSVSAVSGPGACLLDPPCEVLVLKPGQKKILTYDPLARDYAVEVVRIRRILSSSPTSSGAPSPTRNTATASSGEPAEESAAGE